MVEIRPYEPSDFSNVLVLLNKCLDADHISDADFQIKVLLDPNFSRYGALVAEVEEKIVGFVLGIVRKDRLEDAPHDFDKSWITLIAVDKDYRHRKIGTMLLDWLEEYLTLHGCESIWVSPYAPNYFTPGIDINAYPDAVHFFCARGYNEAYHPLSMKSDLTKLKKPAWLIEKENALDCADIKIECFRPEMILPVLDFIKNEFPGDWQRCARMAMAKIANCELYPTSFWAALNGEKVVGYCQHDGNGRFGPFGVSAKHRGKGIGLALLFNCLAAMRENGMQEAWFMWTDDKTAKLYSVAGFVETRRFTVFSKTILQNKSQ